MYGAEFPPAACVEIKIVNPTPKKFCLTTTTTNKPLFCFLSLLSSLVFCILLLLPHRGEKKTTMLSSSASRVAVAAAKKSLQQQSIRTMGTAKSFVSFFFVFFFQWFVCMSSVSMIFFPTVSQNLLLHLCFSFFPPSSYHTVQLCIFSRTISRCVQ